MSAKPRLNAKQKEAVEATEGRILVLAGAGSGKTSVLINRIAHLIDKGVPPKAILGLTFTNKAAEEMRARVSALIGAKLAKDVTLATFHSFCMGILREEIERLGYTSNFTLYDEKDIKRLVTNIAKQMLEHDGELPSLAPTIEQIKAARSKGTFDGGDATWHDKFSKELFLKLNDSMRSYNAVDFDSLLTLTVDLFEKFPEALDKFATRFRYIMIDEYQDTSPIQYKLAHLLSSKWNNLFVVGDDDQSIYGWRGALVDNILNFQADQVVKLEQNYRSTPTILNAANAVIAKNTKRHAKELWSSLPHSEPIEIFHAPTELDETGAVIDRIVKLKQDRGYKWSDFAILYRSNTLARPFEAALIKTVWRSGDQWMRGIPYQVFGGTEMVERSEVKDLMSYLRAIANPKDEEALLRIINFPRRGISDETIAFITKTNRKEKKALWTLLQEIATHDHPICNELTRHGSQGITSFVTFLKKEQEAFRQKPMKVALKELIDSLNFKKAVSDEVKSEKMKAFKQENIDACIGLIGDYEESAHSPTLPDFLATSLLNKQHQTRQKKLGENKLSLMTLHSAKGLEFPVCCLVALENHLLPHEKSLKETGIEEERRLFYVGLTRAKERLILSMAKKRARYGKEMASEPSRFLYDIPKELLRISCHKSL